jgi:hypothetical protein
MMGEVLSLFVWCRHDPQTDTMQLQVVNVDTGQEVRLNQGIFLLRIFSLQDGEVQRCFIRHIASGREANVQGGSNLQTSVRECVVQSPNSSLESVGHEDPDTPGTSDRE